MGERKDIYRVPKPIVKHDMLKEYNKKTNPQMINRSDYEEDMSAIKDKLQLLINKGRSETLLESPAEKARKKN